MRRGRLLRTWRGLSAHGKAAACMCAGMAVLALVAVASGATWHWVTAAMAAALTATLVACDD